MILYYPIYKPLEILPVPIMSFIAKEKMFCSSLVAQWVKDPVLSLLGSGWIRSLAQELLLSQERAAKKKKECFPGPRY